MTRRRWKIGDRVHSLDKDPAARDVGTVIDTNPFTVRWVFAGIAYAEDPDDPNIQPTDTEGTDNADQPPT